MRNFFDSLLTVVLAVSALGVSGAYAYRTIRPGPQSKPGSEVVTTKMPSWTKALAVGRMVAGDDASPATMIVFADFQCPACRGFHRTTLKSLREKYPRELRVLYVHFPLSYHAQAMPAARATECIAPLGDVSRWVDLLYDKQDSLGVKSYGSFARDIGIADTARVVRCTGGTEAMPRIDAGSQLGNDISIRGTPTIALNGCILSRPPSIAQVDSVIENAKAGREFRC